MNDIVCSKCGTEAPLSDLLPIETNDNIYYYCISCLKEAQALLSMKLYLNKDERKLLKELRKFLKRKHAYEKN